MQELAFLDAHDQAALVREREISPLELVDQAIARIVRLNPALNAVTTELYHEARAAAKRPLPDGPFAGVPTLLKDLGAAMAGVRQTSGSAFLRDFVPTYESVMVSRLRASSPAPSSPSGPPCVPWGLTARRP